MIDLIASGYEWVCPNCEQYNREIEITETVTCPECGRTFKVSEYHHAFE